MPPREMPEYPSDGQAQERLANLQAVTDNKLTALDVDELLAELLERVQDIFDADTVAVLMLDRGSDELVARAARGECTDEGLERLRRATSPGPADRVAGDIMRQVTGRTVLQDDVALVVMGRAGDGVP